MAEVRPIVWKGGKLFLLDQRKLPTREILLELKGARDTAKAIKDMVVRGAPAIGVTAAFGLAMEAERFRPGKVRTDLGKAVATLEAARPTAINLKWALERLSAITKELLSAHGEDIAPRKVALALRREAETMVAQDIEVNRELGRYGAKVLTRSEGVLTHCNAGALATAGFGTALGVIRSAWESGTRFGVYATETRPYLQGARLTSWELTKLKIPVTLLTDGMVGHLFASGRVSDVVVGTDRTAANGDVCNKIGTYQIAVLARRHDVGFYVAAPTSSIDLDCSTGESIPIEQRGGEEVTHVAGRRFAAEGVDVFNPAFDVTPAELVTGIITESGVVKGDYVKGLARAVKKARARRED